MGLWISGDGQVGDMTYALSMELIFSIAAGATIAYLAIAVITIALGILFIVIAAIIDH
jgi:hypothetical protein